MKECPFSCKSEHEFHSEKHFKGPSYQQSHKVEVLARIYFNTIEQRREIGNGKRAKISCFPHRKWE
jgi:hypothetical protein